MSCCVRVHQVDLDLAILRRIHNNQTISLSDVQEWSQKILHGEVGGRVLVDVGGCN
eukprot:SAG31_NODE_142_length_22669_cov_18.630040_17_plen_56_part_00